MAVQIFIARGVAAEFLVNSKEIQHPLQAVSEHLSR